MAITSEIRKHGKLVVVVIGLAILAFLMMDVFSSNSLFNGSAPSGIGEIDGEEVSYSFFEQKFAKAQADYRLQTQQENIDEATMATLRDNVWNEMIRERLTSKEYAQLGIMVSEDELYDLVQGTNVHPQVKQAFVNQETGEFDPAQVINFLKNLDNPEMIQPEMRERWLQFEAYIKNERLNQKYNNLISKAVYANKFDALATNLNNNSKANIRFVVLDYNTVADSTVTVNDSDLKAYYEKNKGRYKQEMESRSVEYVVFDILPSSEDTIKTIKSIEDLYASFQSASSDSSFVSNNSDLPVDGSFQTLDRVNFMIAGQVAVSTPGTIVGPYEEEGYIKMTKLAKTSMRADSVKARHILIKPSETQSPEVAKALADSLADVVRANRSLFETLATTYSEDPGSAIKGGDLGFFQDGQMVKPFNDASFNGNAGDIVVVASEFGYHIIEILVNNKTKMAYQLYTVANKIEPSSDTYRNVYDEASKFRSEVKSAKDFEKIIADQKLIKRVAESLLPSDRTLANLPGSREVVKWAYKSKVGDISNIFDSEARYIVAVLTSVTEKGFKKLESVKDQVETAVRNEKKAEQLKARFTAELPKASGDIEKLAAQLGSSAQPALDIAFGNNFIPAVGRENKLLGAIFGAEVNKLSGPVAGERGVFVFIVDVVTQAPAPEDLAPLRAQFASQFAGRIQGEVMGVLKERGNVVDNMIQYY